MKRLFSSAISLMLLCVLSFNLSCAGMPQQQGNASVYTRQIRVNGFPFQSQQIRPQPLQYQQQATPQTAQASSTYWTGNGGSGMSLTILAPKATGLEENQSYLPSLVQGEFVSNFSAYSAISVMDRENLDKVYAELLSGYYSDNDMAGLDLGHLRATDYVLTGNITRTATGYALQMQITKTADKMTTASYSGTFTFAELDNLTGIRRASLNLLQKMGITLTATAMEELTRAATTNHVNAQTALAQGITAQRQGTEIAALSYYFQASAYDPTLLEAANRSSILNANITSGNIGSDIRNDIAWRRDWVARLTETEQFIDSFNRRESMPYTLFYVPDIKQGTVNYQTETVNLSIETHLHGSGIWTLSIERTLQAVYDGLDATKRKNDWQLASWPQRGVTNLSAFEKRSQNFSVVFELLNNQNKVIGRQTLQSGGSWQLNWSGRPAINVDADVRRTLNFQNVNANDISDRMTIRVTTVNGMDAETAARNRVLQIRASTKAEFDKNDQFRFSRGIIQGFSSNTNNTEILDIPDNIWGDPVIWIGDGFRGIGLTKVTIPGCIASIPSEAFRNNKLTTAIIGNGVTSIGPDAFKDNRLSSVSIPNSITTIYSEAFRNNRLTSITIPEGVITIWNRAFADNHWTTNERLSDGSSVTHHHGLTSVAIATSVTSIGQDAFASHWTTHSYSDGKTYTYEHWLVQNVKIGSNVNLRSNAIGNGFESVYTATGRQAGIYRANSTSSGRWERFDDVETMKQTLDSRLKRSIVLGITASVLIVGGLITWAILDPNFWEYAKDKQQ